MPTGRITNETVAALPIPTSGKLFLWDDKISGFGVCVTPKGRRTYILQYRMGGRATPTQRYTIGRHGSPWTPKLARDRALELLLKIHSGMDPIGEAKAAHQSAAQDERLRFINYVETFKERHIIPKGIKSGPQFEAIMRDHAIPAFGDRLISEISKKDIVELVDRASQRTNSTANRVFDWLRTMMRFAVARSDIAVSPLDGLKRPYKIPPRQRALTDQEVQRVWEAACDLGRMDGILIQLLILTGQRLNEINNMSWSEIDLERRIWTVPGDRVKNRSTHLVPLSQTIVDLLTTHWPSSSRSGLLFGQLRPRPLKCFGHIKNHFDLLIARRVRLAAEAAGEVVQPMPHFQFHDFRRTLATGLQRLGTPVEHTEAVLNHKSGTRSSLVDTYQLHRYLEEKAVALQKWHAHIAYLMEREDAWPGGKDLPWLPPPSKKQLAAKRRMARPGQ